MAFFVQHFEQLITYLDQPGVPRTSNHAERANRHYRACTRPRYGWKTRAGQQALLIVLQGFDSSYLYSLWDSLAEATRQTQQALWDVWRASLRVGDRAAESARQSLELPR